MSKVSFTQGANPLHGATAEAPAKPEVDNGTSPVEPAVKFSPVNRGEIIQQGDEWFNPATNKWEVSSNAGLEVGEDSYRRKVGSSEPVVKSSEPAPGINLPAERPTSAVQTFLQDDDSIRIEDIVFPRINIVQKVGELSNTFNPGEIVYNQQLVLRTAKKGEAPEPAPLRAVVIGFKPDQFVQKTTDGSGEIVGSEKEVHDLGGTLDYNEHNGPAKKPLFQRMSTALLVVEQPDGVDALSFPHSHAGKNYSIVLWSMKGAAHTAGAKILKTEKKMGALREGGYRSGVIAVSTKLKDFRTGNSAWVPVIKVVERTTPEFRDWVTSLLGF